MSTTLNVVLASILLIIFAVIMLGLILILVWTAWIILSYIF
jgi:hypothetical protein